MHPGISSGKNRPHRPGAGLVNIALPTTSYHPPSGPSPHIRTPSPTRSSFYGSPPPRHMSLALQKAAMGLPRAVSRSIVVFSLLCAGALLFHLSRGGLEEGMWDASSYSDRRGGAPHGSGGVGAVKKRISSWSNPESQNLLLSTPEPGSIPRPNLSRLNATMPRPSHSGVSRIPVDGAPDKYTTGPLPTLDEAWAYLHPKLRAVKQRYAAQIPQEHELWNPIFNPSLTDEQQRRYHHLRMDWDDRKGDWIPSEKRWLFTTVCRQVAGEPTALLK